MDILLRKARKKDIKPIHALILCSTRRGKVLKRSIRDIEKTLKHFWVIEKEGKVVACCAVEIYNRKLAEIRSLVVDANHLKQGLGTLLINTSIAEAKKKKIYELLAITDRENLFKRQGFSEQLHGQKALFLRP